MFVRLLSRFQDTFGKVDAVGILDQSEENLLIGEKTSLQL